MALKDDIAAAVVAKLKGEYDDIAKAVLTTDGLIPNSLTGNAANKYIGLNTGIEFTGRKLAALEADVKAQGAATTAQAKALTTKIDALAKAVAALTPKDPA